MKRYIRTKCGAIHDTDKYDVTYDDVYTSEIFLTLKTDEAKGWVIDKEDIINESDNIFDLLQAGDLAENQEQMLKIWTINIKDEDYIEKPHISDGDNIMDLDDIAKIYTKQGNDYKLVWEKERGVI